MVKRGPDGRWSRSEAGFNPVISMVPTEHDHGHPAVAPWKPFCTDCDLPNPAFKDETKCSECGKKLGSIKTAMLLDDCPGCGRDEEHGFKINPLVRYAACTNCHGFLGTTKREVENLDSCPTCGGRKAEWRNER